ncbi:MAG TPA: phosphatidylserine decarboxylase [Candidatus Acidoferrum sp.]|nr:phosphatidylserine decarboxylase [Candidatus Acidoferrum sp.]
MVKEGYYFGIPPLVLGVVLYFLHLTPAAVILVLLGLFCLSFFRDPERVIPADPGAIVSPADGRVVVVTDEQHAGRPGKRISIFLAVWNVHVNRSPAAGTITALDYKPGKFLAAMLAAASAENEQNIFTIAVSDAPSSQDQIVCKQIAGYVARRVVAWKRAGDTVARGERIGLVRFGSRADVWLPASANVLVKTGDHVAGGSSILAFLPVQSMGLSDRHTVSARAETNLMTAGLPKP